MSNKNTMNLYHHTPPPRIQTLPSITDTNDTNFELHLNHPQNFILGDFGTTELLIYIMVFDPNGAGMERVSCTVSIQA